MLAIDLTKKLAVVTGAASGIGRATAHTLKACNARVVALDRHEVGLSEVGSGILSTAVVDVTSSKSVADVFARIHHEFGAVDVLVNAAGVLERPLRPEDFSEKEWDRVIATNLKGSYLCCLAAGTRMAKRGSGAIVNVSSVLGLASSPFHAYGASKAGISNLTAGLAADWGRSGVRVNAVAPGFTRTPSLALGVAAGLLSEEDLALSAGLGRLVEPDEVASAIAFLASDLASAITATTLVVDCGYLSGAWSAFGGLRPCRGPGDEVV